MRPIVHGPEEKKSDAQRRRQRTDNAGRPRHADGRDDAPVLDSGGARRRAARARRSRRCACGCWARIWSRFATPRAWSGWSRTPVRTGARRCSSAATKSAACAASTTAGNSTVTARASTCPPNRPTRCSRRRCAITAYPTHEAGGVVWTYMGPREQQPPPPDYEWVRAPATHRYVSKTFEECN